MSSTKGDIKMKSKLVLLIFGFLFSFIVKGQADGDTIKVVTKLISPGTGSKIYAAKYKVLKTIKGEVSNDTITVGYYFYLKCDNTPDTALLFITTYTGPSGPEDYYIFLDYNAKRWTKTVMDSIGEFIPDTAIGKISLINSHNVNDYLGEDIMDRLVEDQLIHASVLSSDKKQKLTVYFHPGGVSKEFAEFQITYSNKSDSVTQVTTDSGFLTESNIHLGITIDELVEIKGEPNSISYKQDTIYHYKLDDFKSSDFLKRYNMPVYYADYIFRDGNLVEFKFGFWYP